MKRTKPLDVRPRRPSGIIQTTPSYVSWLISGCLLWYNKKVIMNFNSFDADQDEAMINWQVKLITQREKTGNLVSRKQKLAGRIRKDSVEIYLSQQASSHPVIVPTL